MGITAILNCYRRPQNLPLQVKAIRQQSIAPTKIWLWVNKSDENSAIDFSKGIEGVNAIVSSSVNFKYHGRFSLGLLSDTKYLAFFDDDTVPGGDWFLNCLGTIAVLDQNNVRNPILGSAGIRLRSRTYMDHDRVGWPSQNQMIEEVDLVGHSWFFERETLNCLWGNTPITFENGEDIQLSFFAKKDKGIRTFCPPHPDSNKSLWGSIKGNELGIDDKAMSNGKVIPHSQFFAERDRVVSKAIDLGWKTLYDIK